MSALNRMLNWAPFLANTHRDKPGATPSGPPMTELMRSWLTVRCQCEAMAALMVEKGVMTRAEWDAQMGQQAAFLDWQMETLYPGFATKADGLQVVDAARARRTLGRVYALS